VTTRVQVQVFDSVEQNLPGTRDLTTISTIAGSISTTPASLVAAAGTYASDYANVNNDLTLLQSKINAILSKLTS
jgi:hypothetical protein